ncbi:hypothetical protein QQ045_019679 [Rhodiola kirilowii]
MSCGKIKDVLTFPEFELKSTYELVIEAIFFMVEMHSPHAATLNRPRNYRCPRAKMIEFDLPQPECGVYLDLKRKECANLFPTGSSNLQSFLTLPWMEFIVVGHPQHRHTAGLSNLLKLSWMEFIAVDSKYFDKGILHLKAESKMRMNH